MTESSNMRRRWQVKEAARFIDVVSAVAFRLEVEDPAVPVCVRKSDQLKLLKQNKI